MRFSVIIASRGRPQCLRRTLTAIRQLDHPSFEVIVVGDAPALEVTGDVGHGAFKTVECDRPNLSIARNLGVAASAGDVCAFIDDDAIPEPMWLRHHEEALQKTGASASVGFVRGPDGIGFQSRFDTISHSSETLTEEWTGEEPRLPDLPQDRVVKLIGTNMVIRRALLARIGGFDTAYAYYLEDADLSWRLRCERHAVAVVPIAEVHHSLAASSRRNDRRVLRTLFDIGRSTAIFLRRHRHAQCDAVRKRLWRRERLRAERAMIRGFCEPRDVGYLMNSLEEGWEDGWRLSLPTLEPLGGPSTDYAPVPPLPAGHRVYKARLRGRHAAIRAAEMAYPERASVISYSLTSSPHNVRYSDAGVWLHTGGQFHSADATPGRFGWCRFAIRAHDEIARVAKQRGIVEIG